jgi:hypothetical protein
MLLIIEDLSPVSEVPPPFSLSLSRSRFPLPLPLSLSLFLSTLPLQIDFPVTVCDMPKLDIGEDADSWYTDVKLQLPASAPLTNVSHY